MNLLIKSWREGVLDKFPFKLEADTVSGSAHKSYSDFIESADFEKKSADFHLGLIPQPYIGNLAEAKVFLLMLNPGFSPGDYYAQAHSAAFKQARMANLKQENGSDDYPFFYLNPQFAWTAGGQWWQNKLRSVAQHLMQQKGLDYREVLQHMSKQVACVELCPYFSQEYKGQKTLLPSMQLALHYAQTEVKEKCQRGEAIAIVTRQKKIWNMQDEKNIFCLEASEARGAHLTMQTEAGQRIYNKLAVLI